MVDSYHDIMKAGVAVVLGLLVSVVHLFGIFGLRD
jgi:hypothetical protein